MLWLLIFIVIVSHEVRACLSSGIDINADNLILIPGSSSLLPLPLLLRCCLPGHLKHHLDFFHRPLYVYGLPRVREAIPVNPGQSLIEVSV
jgi:hypothetical protein